jgi:hypothetical protein
LIRSPLVYRLAPAFKIKHFSNCLLPKGFNLTITHLRNGFTPRFGAIQMEAAPPVTVAPRICIRVYSHQLDLAILPPPIHHQLSPILELQGQESPIHSSRQFSGSIDNYSQFMA